MGFLEGGVELAAVRQASRAYVGEGDWRFREHREIAGADGASGYPHVLISFAYDRDHTFFGEKLGYDPDDWMGDSGAFTAWTQGSEIDLGELIEWCRWHVERKPEFVCVSLDVIPGRPGGNRQPTAPERARAVEESLANGDAMREAGLRIMEVYHVFDPIEHLELLLDRRRPGEVLGLGGMVGRSSELKRRFADGVFARVRARCGGWAGIPPLHALGLSVRSGLAARYPWASLDSSSWIAPAMYGNAVRRDGKIAKRPDGGFNRQVSNRDVRQLHLQRVLTGWLRRETELARMWSERGVTFSE